MLSGKTDAWPGGRKINKSANKSSIPGHIMIQITIILMKMSPCFQWCAYRFAP